MNRHRQRTSNQRLQCHEPAVGKSVATEPPDELRVFDRRVRYQRWRVCLMDGFNLRPQNNGHRRTPNNATTDEHGITTTDEHGITTTGEQGRTRISQTVFCGLAVFCVPACLFRGRRGYLISWTHGCGGSRGVYSEHPHRDGPANTHMRRCECQRLCRSRSA
jgi:hypothetical protein